MPTKIEIIPGTENSPPSVDQYTVRISKGKKERVEWWSRSQDWAVVFESATPFERHYFSPCHSGCTEVKGDAKSYKYAVYVDGQGIDPIIIVDP